MKKSIVSRLWAPLALAALVSLTNTASTAHGQGLLNALFANQYESQEQFVQQDSVPPKPVPEGEIFEQDVTNTGVCESCGSPNCGGCGNCPEIDPWRLFNANNWPGCRGINIYGWVDAGATVNADSPSSNFNGPQTFNDREDFQMNQLYAVMEKTIEEGCSGWQIGGRVDLLYGTDHRYTMARGLETERDFSSKWNSDRFYGLALPQAYVDVALNDWVLRLGHFYTIIGYEVVTAPDNFFYSHAYTMQYGEPFTHTGALLSKKIYPQVEVKAGFHRGWDNWEDYPGNDQLDFLGGATWTSCDENTSVAFAITSGEESDDLGGFSPRTMYSVVLTQKLSPCLTWAIQHDWGRQDNGDQIGSSNVAENAEWYGINQYFLYEINCCWSAGMRVEWFRDDDGTRVTAVGDGNPATGPYEGNFWEVTWGLNYRPNSNVVVRPEIRYDWFDGAAGQNPFDDGNATDQMTAAVDVILSW